MKKHSLLIIPGSLRDASYNKGLARELSKIASEQGMDVEIVDISTIPFYDQDEESSFPSEVQELKNKIRAASGVLVVTPEYNRSIPGVLKNAIDWTSRPYGDSAWAKKPFAVIGTTVGNVGTGLAQMHLRQIMSYLDAHTMGQPEAYISDAMHKFDAEGNLTDENTRTHLVSFVEKFSAHMAIFSK
ncbi:MAG TPA: NADPH-dependent FMN reductase [Candidatus Paceibacterota bacterium]|nr:NADPH-dependent FMN reductase [Candidatus Paceibacterota bacterium]